MNSILFISLLMTNALVSSPVTMIKYPDNSSFQGERLHSGSQFQRETVYPVR